MTVGDSFLNIRIIPQFSLYLHDFLYKTKQKYNFYGKPN